MITFEDFRLVVHFFVRCAFDPVYENQVDSEMQHSEELQKVVTAVKEFHKERAEILSQLKPRCTHSNILNELFTSKKVHSFSGTPEGALCACSGDRATTGLTLVIVDGKDKKQRIRCVSKQYEQMIYHFYELAHFQHIIVARLHKPIPAFIQPKDWADECSKQVHKLKYLYVQYSKHLTTLESIVHS
jgi:hypothetical protein